MWRRTNHVETRNIRASTPRLANTHLWRGAAGAPAAVLLFAWPRLAANLFANGFAEQMFMPHGMCYLWVPQLYFLHVSSDLLIGLSYIAISSTLIYLVL